jgi:1-acyl-sn-glycerol-3-phosphate acyltransferase
VAPAAILGSTRVREWRRGYFPAVTVRYGEPISFGHHPAAPRDHSQQVADEVLEAIRRLHAHPGRRSERRACRPAHRR